MRFDCIAVFNKCIHDNNCTTIIFFLVGFGKTLVGISWAGHI